MRPDWNRFAIQAQKDLRLWLFLLILLALVRMAIVAVHRGSLAAGTGFGEVLVALGSGLRYDSQAATLFCLPSVLVSVAAGLVDCARLGDRLRLWLGGTLAVLTVVVGAVDIGYVGEYGNQYDQFLFGVIFDDFSAILRTIWNSYPVVWALLGMAAGAAGLVWALRWWLRRPFVDALLERRPLPAWARATLSVALVALVVLGARGSLRRRPLQEKDAGTTSDHFLNRLIVTPYHALVKALNDFAKLQRAAGLTAILPDGDLPKAMATLFPGHPPSVELDDYLLRTAPGAVAPPRHVFLLVIESYDAWPFAERYRALGLTDGVRGLGRDGILLTNFVAASTGTMTSLSALLTGLPDVGVFTDYQPSARKPFPTSPAAIFKRLGYRTRFFYSGYLSWHRIGDFCQSQGFEEVHGGGQIDRGASGNEWGAEDEDLFTYVRAHVPDDQPSFNVVLTTSNHPPFNVDVRAKGCPLTSVPPALADSYDGRFSLEVLGHLWYADRSATRFIRAMDQQLPKALFALTGDHWSRRFLNAKPSFVERSTVPLLLYGPSVLAGVTAPAQAAGGHLDIAPTLVELCAPAGFAYHSLGENLLLPQRGLGVGTGRVAGPAFLAAVGDEHVTIHPLPDHEPPATAPDAQRLKRLYQAWSALGWWRIMRGSRLAPDGQTSP
jgi:phosphoglycerol transferase MdoB-like AlkP superfamily enzyme